MAEKDFDFVPNEPRAPERVLLRPTLRKDCGDLLLELDGQAVIILRLNGKLEANFKDGWHCLAVRLAQDGYHFVKE